MITRAPNRERWVTVDNRAVEDARLSLRAKGLLLYLLSRPDHWHVMPKQLATTTTDGVISIRSCLKELARHGYATLTTVATEKGKFGGTAWTIHELPAEIGSDRNSVRPNLGQSLPLVSTEQKVRTKRETRVPDELAEIQADWTDWLQHRRELRKPMTPSTYVRQIAKLKSMGVARAKVAIQFSIQQGYEGLFEPKPDRNTKAQMPYKKRQDKINALNQRKAQLMREPPSRKRDWQIENIRTQLIDL